MDRIEFPSTPINFQKQTEHVPPAFSQLALEGTDFDLGPEIELGYCVVTSKPDFRKRVKSNEWFCAIRCEPDLTYPEQEGEFVVRASGAKADMAHSCHLRPGDSELMIGRLYSQETELENGGTATINYFALSYIEVNSRSPRVSVTTYEQQQGKLSSPTQERSQRRVVGQGVLGTKKLGKTWARK